MFQWALNLLKPKEKPLVSNQTMKQHEAHRIAQVPKPKRPNKPGKTHSRGRTNDSNVFTDASYYGSGNNSNSSCDSSSDSGSTGGGGCE